ncbi:MAG: (2Fe-2S)-binding protein [Chitinophagaceae bacterium]|nr:MAG: (2Fe-2S)-binding protein [Chitinophagaceae bacterium]
MAALQWHKIAESPVELILADNNIAVIEVAGKKICLAALDGQWYGFAYKCPHASGIMANGYINAVGDVVCPLHRYRFSIRNGRNTSGEGYYLKTYPVELRPDGLYVGMAAPGLFGF